uniref:Chromo domain-containing protein n=1 Tax=Strongyloides papillosus TaxID=174720 RepID=A0A0N5BUA7_STREA
MTLNVHGSPPRIVEYIKYFEENYTPVGESTDGSTFFIKKANKPSGGRKRKAFSKKAGESRNSSESSENEDEENIIERIVDSREINGEKIYKIRWKNRPSDDDTWQTIRTLGDPSIVQEYEKLKLVKLDELKTTGNSDEPSEEEERGFLRRLMKEVRKGVRYRDEEVVGVIDKHFNSDNEKFYLFLLKNKRIVYVHPEDVPENIKEECMYADMKRLLINENAIHRVRT